MLRVVTRWGRPGAMRARSLCTRAAAGEAQPPLLQSEAGGVLTLQLNSPRTRNALSSDMLRHLLGALSSGLGDNRAVVIQGAGPAFCAGHDLRELAAGQADGAQGQRHLEAVFRLCSQVMELIPALPVPVVAAVHGVATAAGCQLVAACDMAVATRGARFATPGVDIGLFCSTPAVALARCVGRKAALDMLFTGRMVGAEEAQRMGLVSSVLETDDAEELHAHVAALAARIASKSGAALAIGKRTFAAQTQEPLLGRAYEVASEAMVRNARTEDAVEGIGAFLAKRSPEWRHR